MNTWLSLILAFFATFHLLHAMLLCILATRETKVPACLLTLCALYSLWTAYFLWQWVLDEPIFL